MVLGFVLLLGGALALMAGWLDLSWTRRIRSEGVAVWARVIEIPMSPDESRDGHRPLLAFTTEDGRALEVFSPRQVQDATVLVHYDPADPTQIVVHGQRGRASAVFIVVGAVAIVGAILGMALA